MFGEHVRVWGHASRRDGLFSCVAFLGLVGRVPRGGHRAAARAGVGENPTGPASAAERDSELNSLSRQTYSLVAYVTRRCGAGRWAASNMRRCAWSLAGLLIAVCVGAAAAGSTVTSAHPAGRRRLTYEYAPTADATPYCRLQNPSVCWGNTHRFLEVTANGPFDGIDLRLSYPKSALADLDGDGTLRPRPSIDKLRSHVLCLSQATWTSWWEMRLSRSPTSRTLGRPRRRCSCKGPEPRTPSTASMLVGTAPRRSETSTTTARADRVRRSINCDRTFSAARRRPGPRRGRRDWLAQLH